MYLEIIEILLRGFCVGVAASITVGPVAVLCIQRTLSKSRRSGIVSGLGVAAADTLMAMIAYFCYSMLQAQIDQYNQLLRVVAGIFVVLLVVSEIPHPFPLNTHFGTLAVGLGSFPFDHPTYLVQSDSHSSSTWHSEFDILW